MSSGPTRILLNKITVIAMEVHRSSIVCPWCIQSDTMPTIIHTTSADIDEDLSLQCGKRTPALCPPGRTCEHKRSPSTRTVKAMVVRSGVEALHPRHAHTRLWRPRVRNQATERRGADTHGAQYRSPRVIRTGSINPLLTGSPYTKTSLIPNC